MQTLSERIRAIAQSYRELLPGDDVHSNELDAIAKSLDARAALVLTADPDQLEAIAENIGNPQADFDGHAVECAYDGCDDSDCPFRVCECSTLPQEQRPTGHEANCAFWNAHAIA